MPETELIPGSEGRARSDRDLAVGLQRGAAPQLAGVSDPGGVRSPSSSAPVAYGSLRAAARPGPGNFASARKPPGSYIMLGLKTGGRSKESRYFLSQVSTKGGTSSLRVGRTFQLSANCFFFTKGTKLIGGRSGCRRHAT